MPCPPLRRLLALGRAATRPTVAPAAIGSVADLARSQPAPVAENALLRHRRTILHRSVKRPRCSATGRALLVLLASRVRDRRAALLIVRPDTLLRWHRHLLRLRGAGRIRGELLTLGIRVARSTIRRYPREARPPRRARQDWSTFPRKHAPDIRACDFRPLYARFIVALATRRAVPVGVTRHPTDARVARRLREATPFDQRPRCLARDNGSKDGAASAHVAATTGITELRTAYRAPRQNATCERFLGGVRRECLDRPLILGGGPLRRTLRAYVRYFNHERPHQGSAHRIPTGRGDGVACASASGGVHAIPVLGGLHHADERAA